MPNNLAPVVTLEKEKVKYTDKQKMDMIITSLRWITIKDSSFGAIAYYVKHELNNKTDNVAYTNGTTIYYGDKFFDYNLEQRAAICVHEILHVAFRHVQRVGHRNHQLYNIAADCVINYAIDGISGLKIPDGFVNFDSEVDSNAFNDLPKDKWTTEIVYTYLLNKAKEKLKKQLKNNPGQVLEGGRSGSNPGSGELEQAIQDLIDEILRENPTLRGDLQKDAKSSAENKDSAVEDQLWQRRVERAASIGTKSNNILRNLLKEFPKSEIHWKKLLKRYLVKACLPQTQANWQRPGRQMLSTHIMGNRVFSPSSKPENGLDTATVIVDVSGSINDTLLAQFGNEIDCIQKQTGTNVYLIFADAQITGEFFVKADSKSFATKVKEGKVTICGGGGTDLRVPIAKAKKIQSKIVIVLTDGYTPFPEKQDVKGLNLIWAMTTDVIAPVGKTIYLKTD